MSPTDPFMREQRSKAYNKVMDGELDDIEEFVSREYNRIYGIRFDKTILPNDYVSGILPNTLKRYFDKRAGNRIESNIETIPHEIYNPYGGVWREDDFLLTYNKSGEDQNTLFALKRKDGSFDVLRNDVSIDRWTETNDGGIERRNGRPSFFFAYDYTDKETKEQTVDKIKSNLSKEDSLHILTMFNDLVSNRAAARDAEIQQEADRVARLNAQFEAEKAKKDTFENSFFR